MAQQEREREDKRNGRSDKRQQKRGRRAAASAGISWDAFHWGSFQALAEALCRHGGAVRLGQTRDGGAWALGIYLGDDYDTEYIRPAEDFIAAIGEVVEAWLPAEYETWASKTRESME